MKHNPNLTHLISKHLRRQGAILEGSSRSGKTWSGVDFVIYLVTNYSGLTINIIRETSVSFKTTLYDDFNRRLPDFGIQSPFIDRQEVPSFALFGSKINMLGADKPSKFHGASCDFAWFNEMMDIPQSVFDQQEQRCRKFWWGDYNPKFTQHWIYDKILKRPDVSSLRTTFTDNPFISRVEKKKILSYDPGNPLNIEAGTADDYMWRVYGLGMRGELKGRVFQAIEWVDAMPEGLAYVYGLDFGFTNDPTALVRIADDGLSIWLELLCYEPIETPGALSGYMDRIGIERYIPITADSSDKYTGENKGTVEMVRDLKREGWKIDKVKKDKSVVFWINKMKERQIKVVHNRHALAEAENYRWRTVNGITINQPVDEFNHFWDASRYGFMSLNPQQSQVMIWDE
jgi:phage terminase large subunit